MESEQPNRNQSVSSSSHAHNKDTLTTTRSRANSLSTESDEFEIINEDLSNLSLPEMMGNASVRGQESESATALWSVNNSFKDHSSNESESDYSLSSLSHLAGSGPSPKSHNSSIGSAPGGTYETPIMGQDTLNASTYTLKDDGPVSPTPSSYVNNSTLMSESQYSDDLMSLLRSQSATTTILEQVQKSLHAIQINTSDKDELSKSKARCNELESELAKMRDENRKLELEKESVRNQMTIDSMESVSIREAELDQSRMDHDSLLSEMKEKCFQISKMAECNSNLEIKFLNSEAEKAMIRTELGAKLSNMENEMKKLRQQLESKSSELAATVQGVNSAEKERLQNFCAQKDAELLKKEAEVNQLMQQLYQRGLEVDQCNATISDLRTRLQSAEVKNLHQLSPGPELKNSNSSDENYARYLNERERRKVAEDQVESLLRENGGSFGQGTTNERRVVQQLKEVTDHAEKLAHENATLKIQVTSLERQIECRASNTDVADRDAIISVLREEHTEGVRVFVEYEQKQKALENQIEVLERMLQSQLERSETNLH